MKYNIKITSLTNSIIFVLIMVPLFTSIIFLSGKLRLSPLLAFPIILCFIPIVYFSWQRFVTGRTEWIIAEDGVSMTWVKQFAFTNKEDIYVKWIEIESIGKMFDPNYYNLKIKLISGKKIMIHHDYFITKEDFNNFIKKLYETFHDTKKISSD